MNEVSAGEEDNYQSPPGVHSEANVAKRVQPSATMKIKRG